MRVEVNLALVEGVPPAAVAANVTNAVRYTVQRDIGQKIDELVVLVGGRPLTARSRLAPARGARTDERSVVDGPDLRALGQATANAGGACR